MLSDEQRELLMNGPGSRPASIIRAGGAATLLVLWRRHRQELLDASPPGFRPWAEWMLQRRFKQHPAGEIGQLRAIAHGVSSEASRNPPELARLVGCCLKRFKVAYLWRRA